LKPVEYKNESWKYSEFKSSVVRLYDEYMLAYQQFVDGIQGISLHPTPSRAKFISLLMSFYSDQRGGYMPYMTRRTLPFLANEYDNLVFNSKNITNQKLHLMHLYLITWFNTYGAKALGSEISVFENAIEEALSECFEKTNKTRRSEKYYDMQPLYNFMNDLMHDKDHGIKKNNQDLFFVVTGRTGIGKSYVLLDLFENWYRNVIKAEDFDESFIDYFATTNEQHQKGMAIIKENPFYFLAHDEVVRTAKRRNWNTKDNKKFSELYDVIRGLNIIHGHAIPDFTQLEYSFLKQRIDFLVYVTKEGDKRVANVYGRYRLRELYRDIMDKNITYEQSDVKPNFSCEIPMYNGILLKAYEKQKKIGMIDIVEKYSSEGVDIVKQKDTERKLAIGERIYNLIANEKIGYVKAYKEVGTNNVQGKKYLSEYCDSVKKTLPRY